MGKSHLTYNLVALRDVPAPRLCVGHCLLVCNGIVVPITASTADQTTV
jgi:hypothetical protein